MNPLNHQRGLARCDAGSHGRFPAVALRPATGSTLRFEVFGWIALLLSANGSLFLGRFDPALVFRLDLVQAGEWWRLLAHPLAHVSMYHLACDGLAFLLAYAELKRYRAWQRLAWVIAAMLGSLLLSLWAAPEIAQRGLCGLSAIAHGLTALVGLELWQGGSDRGMRLVGVFCFAAIVIKAGVEAVTGQVLFAPWHLGDVGAPVSVSHAGGILGVLLVQAAWAFLERWRSGDRFTSHFTFASATPPATASAQPNSII